jgi:all-trans-retinol dehydrogenase (NAD+)
MTKLAGKTVLITGGAGGLGRRLAGEAARSGASIVLWDLDRGGLEKVAAELAPLGSARVYACDVSDRKAVYETAARMEADGGPIDVLVNCAGVVSGSAFLDLPDDKIERTFGVNTLALYWTCKAFVPRMVERNRGHVVTLASASGLIGVAKLSDYSASKWAAIGFDESLRVELAKSAPGVLTTVVCPYYINTGMFDGVRSRFPLLLPILDEGDVARRIVRAIERGKRRLCLPWLVSLLPLMRVLPVAAMDRLADFLGVNVSMDEFVGRTHQDSGETQRTGIAR